MNLLGSLAQRFRAHGVEDETALDGDAPAWFVSLMVHMSMIVAIGMLWVYEPPPEPAPPLAALEATDFEPIPIDMTYAANTPVSDDIGAPAAGGGAAFDSAQSFGPTSSSLAANVASFEGDFTAASSSTDTSAASAMIDLPTISPLSTGPSLGQEVSSKGIVGVGMGGVGGAVDRLTQIILASLEQRPTLVVWLFDRSFSMRPQRNSINARFDRIYEELGVAKASDSPAFQNDKQPLLTATVAFGQEVTFLLKEPTDNLEEIRASISAITDDPSGLESTFGAVREAAMRYQRYRNDNPRRNVILVAVTDEVGSDPDRLDEAITIVRRHEIPVYVIGAPATFGRVDGLCKYVDPDPKYDQTPQWLPLDQGPESILPENVQLGFRGAQGEDLAYMDSGFGPYGLTRLCYESGGAYFAIHPNRDRAAAQNETATMDVRLDHSFDPTLMRNYRPDYITPKEYLQLLNQNGARAALVKAAEFSKLNPMENPRLVFEKLDEAQLKRQLDAAQQAAAKLEPQINMLYQTIAQGEKDRTKLTSPRWQAGYDLALGRILAFKVRNDGYNIMLAKAKSGMKFENESSDTWILDPSDKITANSQLEKMGKLSVELLERVKTQHAGTPWALIAERELSIPLGWKWSEKNTGVARRMQARMNNNNNNAPPRPDALRKLEKPKPKREGLKL